MEEKDGLDYSKFDNDPGDERGDLSDVEQFETSWATGGKPEDYEDQDPVYAKKYAEWLKQNGLSPIG